MRDRQKDQEVNDQLVAEPDFVLRLVPVRELVGSAVEGAAQKNE